MEDISLHIMDIVENSIAAGAQNVSIRIIEDSKEDMLELEIKDNGRGMDEEFLRRVSDPFITTKSWKKVGLGLPFLKEAAEAANGSFSIESEKGKGTAVKASFQLSHVDRKPLGDMEETLICLMATFREVDLIYVHHKGERVCSIRTDELKEEAGERWNDFPEWIRFLKDSIRRKFEQLNINTVQ